MDKALLFEFIGTAFLVLLGDGVVANVLLKGSKGKDGGWAVISIAWGLAVFIGASISAPYSGGHLNPAVTLALAIAGCFEGNIIGYMLAQTLGASAGAVFVYVFYKPHFDIEEDKDKILAVFSTGPAIRNTFFNCVSECLATFILMLGIFYIGGSSLSGPLPIGLLVIVLCMCLGGTTGLAINPARDIGPRIVHALLPIKNKRDSDWAYSWVPVVAPLVGGALAAVVYLAIGI